MDLTLPGLGRTLRLVDCPEVGDALRAAMPGWRLSAEPGEGEAPAIRLQRERSGQGFRQYSPEFERGLSLPTVASAACSLVADLVGSFCERHAEMVGLHCGSVEIDGRLLIYPASHKAGKSTLTAAFAAAGYRVFGDDVLALTPEGEGMGLGIAPRLRLPLPASLDPRLRAFAERHAGPQDERYRYLALPRSSLAPHGERRPLGALVLLEREEGLDAPETIELAPGEGLLRLLCQNFADDQPSEALMARFLPLMERLPCWLVRYGEPLAAARHLARRCAGWPARDGATASVAVHVASRAELPAVSPTRRWRAVEARHYPLGDELFLIEPAGGAIHRLNASGRIVWALLEREALCARELAELLGELYEGMAVERLMADVTGLLSGLAAEGLILPLEAP